MINLIINIKFYAKKQNNNSEVVVKKNLERIRPDTFEAVTDRDGVTHPTENYQPLVGLPARCTGTPGTGSKTQEHC